MEKLTVGISASPSRALVCQSHSDVDDEREDKYFSLIIYDSAASSSEGDRLRISRARLPLEVTYGIFSARLV